MSTKTFNPFTQMITKDTTSTPAMPGLPQDAPSRSSVVQSTRVLHLTGIALFLGQPLTRSEVDGGLKTSIISQCLSKIKLRATNFDPQNI